MGRQVSVFRILEGASQARFGGCPQKVRNDPHAFAEAEEHRKGWAGHPLKRVAASNWAKVPSLNRRDKRLKPQNNQRLRGKTPQESQGKQADQGQDANGRLPEVQHSSHRN